MATVISLLVFALLIQNTCPFGAAGRSTVTQACSHCPCKHSITAPAAGQTAISIDSSWPHFPLFVFAVPKPVHTFQLMLIQSARPVLAAPYQDALPDDLLQPPRA